MRKYKIKEVITFAKTTAEFGGLSNMAPDYDLFINEINIQSVEVLYQSCRFPLYPDIQEKIIKTQNPMKAKEISRVYLRYSRQDWDKIKFKLMRWCLEVKLIQNFDKFSKLLLSTGNKDIVEFSKKDDIWGARPSSDGEYLIGKNALGRLLMELREKIYNEEINKNSIVQPPNITGFLLYDNRISRVLNEQYFMEDWEEIFDIEMK